MMAQEGDVKLTDFGIAKALDLMYNEEGDVIAGKDEYLSPEQARREVTDGRADLFCCGIVISEMLLGYNFFEDADPETTIDNILNLEIPDFPEKRPDIDPKLNQILRKSLENPTKIIEKTFKNKLKSRNFPSLSKCISNKSNLYKVKNFR